MINIMTKSYLERKEFMSSYSLYYIIQEVRTGIPGRKRETRAHAERTEKCSILICSPWPAQLSYSTLDYLPGDGTAHSELCPSHQSFIKKIPHRLAYRPFSFCFLTVVLLWFSASPKQLPFPHPPQSLTHLSSPLISCWLLPCWCQLGCPWV